jgi:hypothetical protein
MALKQRSEPRNKVRNFQALSVTNRKRGKKISKDIKKN